MTEEYQTGPFCRHWSDPADCNIECAACGHRCCRHDIDDNDCMDCGCKAWVEPECETVKTFK